MVFVCVFLLTWQRFRNKNMGSTSFKGANCLLPLQPIYQNWRNKKDRKRKKNWLLNSRRRFWMAIRLRKKMRDSLVSQTTFKFYRLNSARPSKKTTPSCRLSSSWTKQRKKGTFNLWTKPSTPKWPKFHRGRARLKRSWSSAVNSRWSISTRSRTWWLWARPRG